MQNLYQVADQYLQLLARLDELPDEDMLGELDKLNAQLENFEDIAINLAAHVKNLEGELMALTAAIDGYRIREDRLENKIDRLKTFLRDMLIRVKIPSVTKDPLHKLQLRINPASVSIVDIDLVPKDYFITKEAYMLDKAGIKEALQKGLKIPGCELVNTTRIDIK